VGEAQPRCNADPLSDRRHPPEYKCAHRREGPLRRLGIVALTACVPRNETGRGDQSPLPNKAPACRWLVIGTERVSEARPSAGAGVLTAGRLRRIRGIVRRSVSLCPKVDRLGAPRGAWVRLRRLPGTGESLAPSLATTCHPYDSTAAKSKDSSSPLVFSTRKLTARSRARLVTRTGDIAPPTRSVPAPMRATGAAPQESLRAGRSPTTKPYDGQSTSSSRRRTLLSRYRKGFGFALEPYGELPDRLPRSVRGPGLAGQCERLQGNGTLGR